MIWKYGDHIGWGPFVQGDRIGTKFDGDRLSRGTKLVGDHLSMGTKFLGTICPWGQEVGDWKSGDQMGLGPNETQPCNTVYQHMLLPNLGMLFFWSNVCFALDI